VDCADGSGVRKRGAGRAPTHHHAEQHSMRNDYIPRPDGEFDAWLNQFIVGCADWWNSHGGDGNLDPLRELRDAWQIAYAASIAADAAARAATAAKVQARAVCEEATRAMVRLVQGTPDTRDSQRAEMGIAIRGTPVLRTGSPPSTAPIVSIQLPARLTHTLRLVDSATPTRTKKPRGVHGAEVWYALAQPGATTPPPQDSFRFHTLATRDSITRQYKPEDGGSMAYYQLRWVSTRGEKGPWSEVCSATVAA
jgi:hypothetical protein